MGGLLCGRPPFVSRAAVTPHRKTAEAPYSRFFHTQGAVFLSGCSLQPTKMWRVPSAVVHRVGPLIRER
jgi:hypothetical protein